MTRSRQDKDEDLVCKVREMIGAVTDGEDKISEEGRRYRGCGELGTKRDNIRECGEVSELRRGGGMARARMQTEEWCGRILA